MNLKVIVWQEDDVWCATVPALPGCHHIYTKENISTIVIIPVHGNRDLPVGTLKGILRDTGLTENDI